MGKTVDKEAKRKKLADALRANLKRRKVQAKKRENSREIDGKFPLENGKKPGSL